MGKKKISQETIEKIKQLRHKGFSLPEISKETGTAKTTVFRYIKGVEILPEFKNAWLVKRGGSRKRKLVREEKALKEASSLLDNLTYREKIIFLSAIYWGEGSKAEFGLSNTDPEMIRVFVIGLRDVLGVKHADIRVSVRLYEDLNKDESLSFWSGVTGVPKERFISVNVLQGKKKGKLKYGMCRVRVTKGGDILKKIKAVNKVIANLFVPIAQLDRAPRS